MAEQWAATIGHLPCHDERPADRTGKVARGHTGWGHGKLAADDGKVLASGDREGGQGRLWFRTAGRWRGFRYRGRDTCHETAVASALTEIGLRVYPR